MAEIVKHFAILRFDTWPDHWRCTKCDRTLPHVHVERDDDGIQRWHDYGYDVRDKP